MKKVLMFCILLLSVAIPGGALAVDCTTHNGTTISDNMGRTMPCTGEEVEVDIADGRVCQLWCRDGNLTAVVLRCQPGFERAGEITLFANTYYTRCYDATTSSGNSCTVNGSPLAHGATQSMDCNDSIVRIANGRQCYLYCDNGNLKPFVDTCISSDFYLMDRDASLPDVKYKRCGTLADACAAAGRMMIDGKCDCGPMNYEWSVSEGKCVESADHKACVAPSSGARWDDINGNCVCLDTTKYWNLNLHKCELKPNQAQCNDYISKLTSLVSDNKSKLRWNGATNKCECIADVDGNDVSDNSDDYYLDDLYRCVKLPSVLYRENVVRNSPIADKTRNNIKQKIQELKDISSTWEKSHWKNSSGGFNTARLASDSVAGVVLGTVGGVITSNVIKKNQVKGGFEDINCTVGGQRIAGYADEFNVGIQ